MNIPNVLVRAIEHVYFLSINIVVMVQTYMYLMEQTNMIESLNTSYFLNLSLKKKDLISYI